MLNVLTVVNLLPMARSATGNQAIDWTGLNCRPDVLSGTSPPSLSPLSGCDYSIAPDSSGLADNHEEDLYDFDATSSRCVPFGLRYRHVSEDIACFIVCLPNVFRSARVE